MVGAWCPHGGEHHAPEHLVLALPGTSQKEISVGKKLGLHLQSRLLDMTIRTIDVVTVNRDCDRRIFRLHGNISQNQTG